MLSEVAVGKILVNLNCAVIKTPWHQETFVYVKYVADLKIKPIKDPSGFKYNKFCAFLKHWTFLYLSAVEIPILLQVGIL